jgi:hypothetical protein
MRHLRDTIHSVLAGMQHLAQDLLLDWWPTIELERIHDDLATHRPGFSFLSYHGHYLRKNTGFPNRNTHSLSNSLLGRLLIAGPLTDRLYNSSQLIELYAFRAHCVLCMACEQLLIGTTGRQGTKSSQLLQQSSTL